MRKRIILSAFLCCAMAMSACGTGNTKPTSETSAETTTAAAEAVTEESETTTAAPETEEKEPFYIPESGMAKAAFCDEIVAANSFSALSENYDSVVITETGTEGNGESMSLKIVISEFEGKSAASFTYDFDDLKITMFATDTYAIQSSLNASDFNSDISIIHPRYKGRILEKQFINFFPEDAYLCDIREEEGVYVVEMGAEDSDDDARLYYYINPKDFSLIKINGEGENGEGENVKVAVDFEYNSPTALDMTAYNSVFGGDDLISVTFCLDPDTENEYSCTLKIDKNTNVSVYAEECMQHFYKDKEMTEPIRDISELDGATIYSTSEKGLVVYNKSE